MADVLQNFLFLPLFCVGQLSHIDGMLTAVELVQELLLHLSLILNGLGLQISIQVKRDTFQRPDELLYHQVTVYASIIACLNEMACKVYQPFCYKVLCKGEFYTSLSQPVP